MQYTPIPSLDGSDLVPKRRVYLLPKTSERKPATSKIGDKTAAAIEGETLSAPFLIATHGVKYPMFAAKTPNNTINAPTQRFSRIASSTWFSTSLKIPQDSRLHNLPGIFKPSVITSVSSARPLKSADQKNI